MPQIKSFFNQHKANGLQLIVIVGQNDYQYPATTADAKKYKQNKGFSDDVLVVADANWKSVQSAIYDGTGTLPGYHVVDGTGKLVFSHSNWAGLSAAQSAVTQILNGN